VTEPEAGSASRRRRRRRASRPAGPPTAAAAAVPPAQEKRAPKDDRSPKEDRSPRGLRDLVGSGHSQLGVSGALRGRDVNRPSEADLAEAEATLKIVRRNWKPQ